MTLRLAAVASGRGSNVAAMIRSIENGQLDAKLVLVLSNNPQAGVLDMAREKGIPVWAQSHKGIVREEYDSLLVQVMRQAGVDTVALAGYMRMITPVLLQAFSGRVLNVHPALLPSFPGVNGGGDAIDYGVRFTGVTVHFVDEGMDSGPVIIQGVLPVGFDDTESSLMPRIHALEHMLYAQALQWLAEGRLAVAGRKVQLLPSPSLSSASSQVLASSGSNDKGPWLISPPLEI